MALRRALLLMILIAAFTAPLELPGCGGGPPEVVFTLTKQPDDPNAFLLGKLGVLQPTYDTRFLVIAYRHLVGVGLTAKERDALAEPTEAPDNPQPWVDARTEVKLPLAEAPTAYRAIAQQGYLDLQLNCGPDAFRTAAATLRDRAQRFGADSPLLREWISAQDLVFANCKSGESIPQPATDPRLRADRDYQIAAAKFYARRFDDARASFERIAHDAESPWRISAPYLEARCLIRAGKFAEADHLLEAILADPARSTWHDRTRRLRNYVALRTRRGDRLRELGQALALPNSEQTIQQDLTDYCMRSPDGPAADDLSDWIATLRDANREHGLEKWRAAKSLPWLVAAIQSARPADPDKPALLAAARNVPPASPAYLSVSVPALRLMPADAARTSADRLLRTKLPVSARNQILAERLRLARNFDEFLRYAPRTPAGEFGMDGEMPGTSAKTERYLDLDAANVLNAGVPLHLLKQAAESPSLPGNLREQLKRAHFARSIILSTAPDFDDVLALLRTPAMSPWLRAGYGRYGVGHSPNRLEIFRDNWWGAIDKTLPPVAAAFLSPDDRAQASREWDRLRTVPAAPSWLGAQTLAFAATHPDDPRLPEALHRVVRASRFGYADADNGKYSHRAFDLLHQRYPKSDWAQKTPYWFK